jgi:hypothetical protein
MPEELYNTINPEDGIQYLKTKTPENPFLFPTTISSPKKGIAFVPGRKDFSINQADWDRYAEGFTGDTQEDLNRYREQTQSPWSKGFSSVIGGIVSGLGTFVEDIGYIADIDTYKAIFSDIDQSSSKELGLWDYINPVPGLLQQLGQGIKNTTQEYLPVYEKPGETLGKQVFNWNNLKGIIDSVVGFSLTGMGAGTAIKGLAKIGVGTLGKLGEFGERAMLSERAAKIPKIANWIERQSYKAKGAEEYLNMVYKGITPATNPLMKLAINYGPTLATSVLTKGAEARMEGLESFQTNMTLLQPLVDQGVITKQDAIDRANKEANVTFDATMALFATDALMLRNLFKPKANIFKAELKNPLALSTKLKQIGEHLLGTPKEGLEEMWQEAIKMEGLYSIYDDLKNRMSKDQRLQYISNLGFDPDKAPKSFAARLAYLFDTTQAKTAGVTGMLTGPFQSVFLHGLNKKANKAEKEQNIKEYNEQQSIYKNNESLFGVVNDFENKLKSFIAGDGMQKLATTFNDTELYDIAQEAQFTRIVAENLVKGSTDQLREVIQSNKQNTEATKLINLLDKFEDSFIEAKKYVNPMDVFLKNRQIQATQKLVDIYNKKSLDTSLGEKDRANFATEAIEQSKVVEQLKRDLIKLTSKPEQLRVAKELRDQSELADVYNNIGNITSIAELNRLLEKYPDDIYIKEQLNNVKNSVPKVTAPIEKEGIKVKVNKTINKVKDKTNDIVSKIKEKTGVEVNEESIKTQNLVSPEEASKGRKIVFGTKLTSNDVLVPDRDALDKKITEAYKEFNKVNGLDENSIIPSREDKDSFSHRFDEGIDIIDTETNSDKFSHKIISDLYMTKFNQKQGEIPDTQLNIPATELEKSGNDFLELLSIDNIVNNTTITEEDVPSVQEFSKLNKTQRDRIITDALYDLIEKADNNKLNIRKDFKSFLKFFADINPALTSLHFNRLKGLFMATTGRNVEESSYNETMGIKEPDLTNDPEMPTSGAIKDFIEENSKSWINPKYTSEDLVSIYTDDSIEALDNRNRLPASSFAFLSQDWWFELKEKEVKKTTANSKVDPNPILNANKFNAGDVINFALNETYDGDITLNDGTKVNWNVFLKEYKANETNWRAKYKIGKKELITDYWPITISTNEDGMVAYVHNVNWINKLNVIDTVKENSKELLRTFKKNLYNRLIANGNSPIEGTVEEKTIDISNEGNPVGFVLNTSYEKDTSIQLPDSSLKFGIKGLSGMTVPKGLSVQDNILNINFIPDFGSQMSYVMLPLGRKNGDIKYWATPVFNKKLSKTQAKTIRQAIEIFTSPKNTIVNKELYEAYLNKGIDLKTTDGLHKLLKKLVYIYNSKKNISIHDFVREKAKTKPVPVIELQGNKLFVGKGNVYTFDKSVPSSHNMDEIEKYILSDMLFNIDKTNLNSEEDFNFTGINENNEIQEFNGKYNDFIKENTTTFANSTLLRDGSYGYTIQHITRFSMNLEEQVIPIEEKQSAPVTDYFKNETILNAVDELNMTKEEFYSIYLKAVDEGVASLEDIMSLVNETILALKESDKDKKCG